MWRIRLSQLAMIRWMSGLALFYGRGQQPWQAKAPKLPEPREHTPATPPVTPPPFMAVDDRELGEAVTPGEPALEPRSTQPLLGTRQSHVESE